MRTSGRVLCNCLLRSSLHAAALVHAMLTQLTSAMIRMPGWAPHADGCRKRDPAGSISEIQEPEQGVPVSAADLLDLLSLGAASSPDADHGGSDTRTLPRLPRGHPVPLFQRLVHALRPRSVAQRDPPPHVCANPSTAGTPVCPRRAYPARPPPLDRGPNCAHPPSARVSAFTSSDLTPLHPRHDHGRCMAGGSHDG